MSNLKPLICSHLEQFGALLVLFFCFCFLPLSALFCKLFGTFLPPFEFFLEWFNTFGAILSHFKPFGVISSHLEPFGERLGNLYLFILLIFFVGGRGIFSTFSSLTIKFYGTFCGFFWPFYWNGVTILEPFQVILSHFEPFQAIWSHLDKFGAIWSYLESFQAISSLFFLNHLVQF